MAPTLRNANSDVKGTTGDSEEVLALASIIRYEVLQIAYADSDAVVCLE
jgi:hypothetical protein